MGPGCFYPGDENSDWGSRPVALLQWGRNVSIPEIATHYSILFSRTCAPVRERLSILSPISTPEPSATPPTPAAPQLYRSASAPRSTSPDQRQTSFGRE